MPESEKSLSIPGEWTVYSVGRVWEEASRWLEAPRDLCLDMDEVPEIDTAGLQILVLLDRQLMRHGARLRIGRRTEAVRSLLELYRLAGHFSEEGGED